MKVSVAPNSFGVTEKGWASLMPIFSKYHAVVEDTLSKESLMADAFHYLRLKAKIVIEAFVEKWESHYVKKIGKGLSFE